LSEKGRKLAGEIDRIYAQVADALVAPLNNEERHTFLSLLDKVAESIPAPKIGSKKEMAAKR
jgi:hypothetical protein